MTHLWKSEEVYTFDMPDCRIQDVYGKNAVVPLRQYIMAHNEKVTDVRFDEHYPGVHVVIGIPKYPKEDPYFSDEDMMKLLNTYMDYANATRKEILNWQRVRFGLKPYDDSNPFGVQDENIKI